MGDQNQKGDREGDTVWEVVKANGVVSVFVVVLFVHNIQAWIGLLLEWLTGNEIWLWPVAVLTLLCTVALVACWVLMNIQEGLLRKELEFPMTMVAITIALFFVLVGSFYLWAETEDQGPRMLCETGTFTIEIAWWYIAFTAKPPKAETKKKLYRQVLWIIWMIQFVQFSLLSILFTIVEGNTSNEDGAVVFMVQVFKTVLLMEIAHLAYESVVRFNHDVLEEHMQENTSEDQNVAGTMIYFILLFCVLFCYLAYCLFSLVMRQVYIATNDDFEVWLLMSDMIMVWLCCFVTIVLLVFIWRSGDNVLKVPKLSHMLELLGTLISIGFFCVVNLIANAIHLWGEETKTVEYYWFGASALGLIFFLLWWCSSIPLYSYICRSKKLLSVWVALLRVVMLVTVTFAVLLIATNIMREAESTLKDISISVFLISVTENLILFELVHLGSGVITYFQTKHPLEDWQENSTSQIEMAECE